MSTTTQAPPVRRDDPPMVVVFGETNTSKTSDAIYSFGANALILAQPNAVIVGKSVCGLDVSSQIVEVSTFEEIPGWVEYAKANGFGALVVDDGSLLMKRSAALAAERWKVVSKEGKEGFDFGMYTYLAKIVSDVSTALRWAGIPGLISCHVQPLSQHKKLGTLPIGPDLAWKPLVRHLPYEADISLLAVGRKQGNTAASWDYRADCSRGKATVATGDRYDIAPEKAGPLNTAELIREAIRRYGYNYAVPYPLGLEWMDGVAEDIAQAIADGGKSRRDATAPWVQYLQKKNTDERHIRWALRDGVHRAEFRIEKAKSILDGFI